MAKKIDRKYTGHTVAGYQAAMKHFENTGLSSHLVCYKCKRAGKNGDEFVPSTDKTPLIDLAIIREVALDGKMIVTFFFCADCILKLRQMGLTRCSGASGKLAVGKSLRGELCVICSRKDGDKSWIADFDERSQMDQSVPGTLAVVAAPIDGQEHPICNECEALVNIAARIDFSGGGDFFVPPDTFEKYKDS